RPDVLASFKTLAQTGQVEFIGQTFYHSLAYLYSLKEFERQVKKHVAKVEEHFGQTSKVFRNTGMIYCNDLAGRLEKLGFKGVMSEGLQQYLHGRSYNHLYTSPNTKKIKTIIKNYKLSADFTHKFTDTKWSEYPLSPKKYAKWISEDKGDCVNIFMPYETFGQHLSVETGAFEFIQQLPRELSEIGLNFMTASDQVDKLGVNGIYDVHVPSSWRDSEKDLSAWSGNNMQQEALQKLYSLEDTVINSKDENLIHVWSKLQTSDHFYYLNTKDAEDGATRDYLSPYDSPYSAYIYYMNALADLEITCKEKE
ncbi:MAG: alpha-amylase, partial [Bacteroidota bacterium]